MARNALKVKDSLRAGWDLRTFDALAWGSPRPAIGASTRRTRPHLAPEEVGLHAPVTAAELRVLETELGFATDSCNGVV